MTDYAPVQITVTWDDSDIELRLMKAAAELFDEAERLGLSRDGRARAANWLQDRYSLVAMLEREDA